MSWSLSLALSVQKRVEKWKKSEENATVEMKILLFSWVLPPFLSGDIVLVVVVICSHHYHYYYYFKHIFLKRNIR